MSSSQNQATYRRLMESHGAAIARTAAIYEADPAERQDLVQDIWLAVWRALPNFRGDSSERTYLFRIAHNRGISHVDKRVRDRAEPGDVPDIQDNNADPARQTADSQSLRHLLSALQRLRLPDRQVIQMTLEGLKQRQIAEVLGTTENTVAVRLKRARAKLKALLEART